MRPRCKKSRRSTGGKYYRADNAERFRQIYAEIDKLEKTEAVVNKFTQYKELFPWFVSARAGAVAGSKWFWAKPCCGGCHEIYDLRFTITI